MTQEALIRFFPAEDLPGAFRKTLEVPVGRLALLLQGSKSLGRLGPGRHRLGNWPKRAPDALLLPQETFELRPRIQRLRSGDGQEMDLLWPLTLQLQDPVRFHAAWLSSRVGTDQALTDLEDYLAGRLWQRAAGEAGRYELGDLRGEAQARAGLSQALLPTLASLLSDLGLALAGSQLPEPRTLEDERERLRVLSLAERAARDARFEALFERLEDREMLEHRLAEWAAERGEPPPDAALVERLWQAIESGPEEPGARAQRAAGAIDQEVKALRHSVEAVRSENERRFNQLQARLETAEKQAKGAETEDQIPWLKRLQTILEVVGWALALASALLAYFAPQLTDSYEKLQLWAAVASGVSGALTALSEILIRRSIGVARQRVQQEKSGTGRAGLRQRRAADRLVRARVEAGLKQATESLEAAWKKGFAAGGPARDLAVDLRQVAGRFRSFQEQDVRAANYLAGRYLARDRVPEAELRTVLDLDDDLLARSQDLARGAEGLFEQINAGQVEAARSRMADLENSLNALRNRFIERGAYLMG